MYQDHQCGNRTTYVPCLPMKSSSIANQEVLADLRNTYSDVLVYLPKVFSLLILHPSKRINQEKVLHDQF